jgi:hypothetical protein
MSVLLCPQVHPEVLQALAMELEWKVVTPHIYKAISDRVSCWVGGECFGDITGVPVLLDESTELEDCTNKTYSLRAQVEAAILMSSAAGAKSAVVGFLEVRASFEAVMRQLYEGVNKLTNREWLNSNYFTKRSIFVVDGHQIYENFMSQNDPLRKQLKQELGFKCWYEQFASQLPSAAVEIVEFSAEQKEHEYSFKRINESKHQFENMHPHKKIKQNEEPFIAGYTELYCRTKQFQPKIIQQSGKPRPDPPQFNCQ